MFFRFLKIYTLCALLCIFPFDDTYAMDITIPAHEASYASNTCIFTELPYTLSIDWITLNTDDSLISEINPTFATSYNWIQSQFSCVTLDNLRKSSIYHEDYIVMPDNPQYNRRHDFLPAFSSVSKSRVSGSITVPINQRDTVLLEIEALGPKFKKSVSSMFAKGIMTLRINRPVLLHGHCVEKDKYSFLLIELKNGGYSCG